MWLFVGILGLGITAILLARLLRASSARCVASMTDEQLIATAQEAQDWAETSNPALVELQQRETAGSEAPAP